MVEQYPIITQGLGKLTPQLWERLMAMLTYYEHHARNEEQARGATTNYFLARITGSTEITDHPNRYEYDWEEVILNTVVETDSSAMIAGSLNSEDTGILALNLCELDNIDDQVSTGVNMDTNTTDYPVGFSMMPIGEIYISGGTNEQLEPIVVMFAVSAGSGDVTEDDTLTKYVFSIGNSHDGECT